jgi:hypothetical protein
LIFQCLGHGNLPNSKNNPKSLEIDLAPKQDHRLDDVSVH